ncbi:hypothetical protein TPY_2731 [Sulfobacillus acidophilus TPY]|uniref:C2H2-type domain-containing protein n=1 Tax=Sulfobacillus acidophilus (strain ATCC 700253 / DSM 10332 / NAL) TaxID=679936 RepID=G8TUK3_SULAD|nr:hypothetical protein TPY_2731 [Sulfobacillus acidophilus TPY]AEW04650.1 hypothetical protein Sulac_1150 [Sulfobacillus acidophilus DSM 10332]
MADDQGITRLTCQICGQPFFVADADARRHQRFSDLHDQPLCDIWPTHRTLRCYLAKSRQKRGAERYGAKSDRY